MKRLSLLFVVILGMMVSMGCTKSRSDETNVSIEGERQYKIGIISYAENFESSQIYIKGFKTTAERLGNINLIFADVNADPSKVNEKIDSFLLQEVDAIIDATWFPDPGINTDRKCKEKNIPLIVCDVPFTEESYVVGTDNYTAGLVAGEYLAGVIKEQWDGAVDRVVFEYYEAGGPEVKKRMQGCLDSLRTNGIDVPDERVEWFDNGGQTQTSQSITRDFLTAHPEDRKIIFGSNNDAGGVGILAAVEASNREEDCLIYTYGAESSSLNNFQNKENCWIGSVAFSTENYGEIAIPLAIDLINGKTGLSRKQGPTPYMVDRASLR